MSAPPATTRRVRAPRATGPQLSVAMLREGAKLITDADFGDAEFEATYAHATDMLAYSVENPSPGNCRLLAFAIVRHAAEVSRHEVREDAAAEVSRHEVREDAAAALVIYAAKVLRWCDQNKAKGAGQ